MLALVASDILMLNLMTDGDKASLDMFRMLVQVSSTGLSVCRLKVQGGPQGTEGPDLLLLVQLLEGIACTS